MKSAAALGLLLTLYLVTSAYLGAMTTEPQARATGFGSGAVMMVSGGGDRAQVLLKAPREAVLAPGGTPADPTVTITTSPFLYFELLSPSRIVAVLRPRLSWSMKTGE